MLNYRPPDSDSDDDYEGFYFHDALDKKPRSTHSWYVSADQELYVAVLDGDLEKLKDQLRFSKYKVNAPIKNGFTLLLHACKEGHLEIVRYLLKEKGANVNRQVDSFTPLMFACDPTNSDAALTLNIVLMLLQHGAVVNVSDKYGTTPLMLASKNGFTAVVGHMIKDASVDAMDNQGCTPIFHAVENNRPGVVQMLVAAGADASIANKKGYTPLQVAQFHGFYDLLQLLPKERESVFAVPSTFLTYNTLRDYIPQIFLKSDCPEYFQEINSVLIPINMTRFIEHLAKEHISLAHFLAMDGTNLERVGIGYPIHRMKILKGLLDFHLHHWSNRSIARVSTYSKDNFYELLMITANHLQHLVIIRASLRYLQKHISTGTLSSLSVEPVRSMRTSLRSYRGAFRDLQHTVKYLATFSPPKNPLYIEYDDCVAIRAQSKLKRYFKCTTIIVGISIFLCLKVKKLF